jgi:hypothetical protein
MDDVTLYEKVRVYFIGRRQHDVYCVVAVQHGSSEGVPEHQRVHTVAGPAGSLKQLPDMHFVAAVQLH